MKNRLYSQVGTLRQLEILLAVYESGSVKGACERLHLTQPTVSMQLKKLSEAIGLPLYDLVGKKIQFTEAGRAVVNTANEVLERFSHLDMELSELRGLKSGTLKISVVTTAKYVIPHLLGPFCRQFPGVNVELEVNNRKQILKSAIAGHSDFYVFSHLPENLDFQVIEFMINPLIAIAEETHPWAQRQQIPLQEIVNESFIIRESGSGTRHAIERYMSEQGLDLNVNMTIESNEAIKHAVMSGLGISILSAHTLAYGGDNGLTKLDVVGLPIETHWFFVWNRHKKLSILAKAFLNFVESEGRKLLESEIRNRNLY